MGILYHNLALTHEKRCSSNLVLFLRNMKSNHGVLVVTMEVQTILAIRCLSNSSLLIILYYILWVRICLCVSRDCHHVSLYRLDMFDLAGAPVAVRIPCTSILSSLANN